jgi:hypothetical protein
MREVTSCVLPGSHTSKEESMPGSDWLCTESFANSPAHFLGPFRSLRYQGVMGLHFGAKMNSRKKSYTTERLGGIYRPRIQHDNKKPPTSHGRIPLYLRSLQ